MFQWNVSVQLCRRNGFERHNINVKISNVSCASPSASPQDFLLHCNRTIGSLDLGLFAYWKRDTHHGMDKHFECKWVTTHRIPLRKQIYTIFGISISMQHHKIDIISVVTKIKWIVTCDPEWFRVFGYYYILNPALMEDPTNIYLFIYFICDNTHSQTHTRYPSIFHGSMRCPVPTVHCINSISQ